MPELFEAIWTFSFQISDYVLLVLYLANQACFARLYLSSFWLKTNSCEIAESELHMLISRLNHSMQNFDEMQTLIILTAF